MRFDCLFKYEKVDDQTTKHVFFSFQTATDILVQSLADVFCIMRHHRTIVFRRLVR